MSVAKHPGYGRDGRRLCVVDQMTTGELRAELVDDAVAGHATPPQRYIDVIRRISLVERTSVETVHTSIIREAQAAGVVVMPGTVT